MPSQKKKQPQQITKGPKPQVQPVNLSDINTFIAEIDKLREEMQPQMALLRIQQALQQQPQNHILLDLLGEVCTEVGDMKNAKQAFQKSIQLKPDDGYTKYMYLAQISQGYDAAKLFQKGISIVQQMKKNPTAFGIPLPKLCSICCDAYCSIAELFMTDLCMDKDAEKNCGMALQAALQEDANSINAYQNMASYRISQQNNGDAKNCMNKVLSIYKSMENDASIEKPNMMFMLNSGKILIELQMYAEAEELLDNLSVELEDVADFWFYMAICNRNLKDYVSAVDQARKAVVLARQALQSGSEDVEFVKAVEAECKECEKLLAKHPEQLKQQQEAEAADDIALGDENDWVDDDDASEDEDMNDQYIRRIYE